MKPHTPIKRFFLTIVIIGTGNLISFSYYAGTVQAQQADTVNSSTIRQSFDLQVPVRPTPISVMGKYRLMYELYLTNFAQEALVLEQVDILDADDVTIIADLQGETLNQRLSLLGTPSDGNRSVTIAPGMCGVLYIELTLDEDELPQALEHRIAYRGADEGKQQLAVVQDARTIVQTEPPVVLAPPLRGGPWAAIYDPSWEGGHRRVIYAVAGSAHIPGRFAIDWVKLDSTGHRARGDKGKIDNWYGYDADVLAVADGIVAKTRDGISESATISGNPDLPLEDGAGNYVALNIGDGRYAFYEHLKPGSIKVGPGERVRRGQVIGAVGFTGHSAGPHLHFHVADANSSLDAEGLPFVFESFDVLGKYEDFDVLNDLPWTPIDRTTGSGRTGELPAPNVVVDFSVDRSPE